MYNVQGVRASSPSSLRNVLSVFSENLAAIEQFKEDMWDFAKFSILLQKLDTDTRNAFELECGDSEVPKYSKLCEFVHKKCRALETTVLTSNLSGKKHNYNAKESVNRGATVVTRSLVTKVESQRTTNECVLCKGVHPLIKCDQFLNLGPCERHGVIKGEKLCFGCFSKNHSYKWCKEKPKCRVCDGVHHTLLHFPKRVAEEPSGESKESFQGESQVSDSAQVSVLASTLLSPAAVLFATALVDVRDKYGRYQRVRALLDSASQASFMSDKFAKRLGLSRSPLNVPICGLNQMCTSSKLGSVTAVVRPHQKPNPSFEIDFLVVSTVCDGLARVNTLPTSWDHIQGLELADPHFSNPGDVDLLLGADIYALVLTPGLKKGNLGEPSAINTVFGWVLLGKVEVPSKGNVNVLCTSVDVNLDKLVKKFWELEEVPRQRVQTPEDISCENHFVKTHARDASGRYVVSLPFREDCVELHESYSGALRRYVSLESRLVKSEAFYNQYVDFMRDYLDAGHMSLIKENENMTEKAYYIPHHGVTKVENGSTKLRVVFDASARCSDGSESLNDLLLVGPTLQRDIGSILLNFRSHRVVFTADVRQMYRQILVVDHHRDFQRILWRFSRDEPISTYRLNTVTYGVTSSPYLAIRTLLQLAADEGKNYPAAAEIIRRDIYVDDVVSGAESVDAALEIQRQLIGLFSCGGFELRKWASNSPELLASLPENFQQPFSFDSNELTSLKILGLQWCPSSDCFSFKVELSDRPATKRNMLSDMARVYDPLGFLTPLTLLAKCLIQDSWRLGLAWDETLPTPLLENWSRYKKELSYIPLISIPRRLTGDQIVTSQLHGFCDSSERAYACVVYLRQVSSNGQIYVGLVCAKSKVAPLRKISIPRLELCGAVLLSEVLQHVQGIYSDTIVFDNMYAWSDSTVALSWIRSHPYRWQTFVANRVTQIQEKVPPGRWFHVSGTSNPADCASRGLFPKELHSHSLWWAGPPWLQLEESAWPTGSRLVDLVEPPELKGEERVLVGVTNRHPCDWISNLLSKCSSLRKIQGVVAYCLRFVSNLKVPSKERVTGALCASELYSALLLVIRVVQRECFAMEIKSLELGKPCSKQVQKLCPFLDKGGIVRVGGRLRHSNLDYDAKHPVLLPKSHRLTELIIRDFHVKNLHPGCNTTRNLLSQQFWILSAKWAIRRVLSQCNRCFRTRPSPITPLMGDLPFCRVSQVKPFSYSGVDFAGPFLVTMSKHRGVKSMKSYICLFVCMATKALHLELVSTLSSEGFLAALQRFIARRGRCSHLYSDCGTNFVGANKLLRSYAQSAAEGLVIKWHFNPPSSPHFGGLWEAGVKSVKSHLQRVVGTQILSYEEFNTVIIRIESVLNSRPLCAVSNDPNDFSALTPSHFLTMEPMCAPPDEDILDLNLNRLSRWQLIRQLHQSFWSRWHVEYLHTLQQRSKWLTQTDLVTSGTLVLIKDDNMQPLQWKLGRISKLVMGHDGISRVATVQTPNGTFDRPLRKLCPLPLQ